MISSVGTWVLTNRRGPADPKHFPYRSSTYITEFFADLDTDWAHDGSTRHRWVADILEAMLAEPHDGPTHPPEIFCRVIDRLMDPADAKNEGPDRPKALYSISLVIKIYALAIIWTTARTATPPTLPYSHQGRINPPHRPSDSHQ